MKKILFTLAVLTLTGCASKYRVDDFKGPNNDLQQGASFYVTLPEDGKFESIDYKSSGEMTQKAIVSALAQHTDSIVEAKTFESRSSAFKQARKSNSKYIFESTILHWEDGATEWSGRPDRITVKYSVYDTKTQKQTSSTVVTGSSKWATSGGDHPADLLQAPTEKFIADLF